MTCGIDATYSLGGELTGVGIYSREILWGLARAYPEAQFRFCYRGHRFRQAFSESLPPNARRWLLTSATPAFTRVFHSLNQRLDAWRYRRAVATFHDLFVMTGDYSSAEFRARFTRQAVQAAARADLIISVSRATAEHLEQLLKVEPSRIRVIPHGVHLPAGAPPADSQRENVILFVGVLQKRKNSQRLVEAFHRTPPGWKLILAGSTGFGGEATLDAVERSPRRDDIVLPGYTSGAELEKLYRKARIFAFPSLDEGFGMPVLEAMAHGVPVLTSRRSAMPEVAGDAAVLVDPEDVESIAEGLRNLMEDEGYREQLRSRSLQRAAEFRWETAVRRTWDVYQEISGVPRLRRSSALSGISDPES
ncbi:MAG: glycosyltransferase family 4 protein [Bryobacteraceae bacterium]|nr:glycosyltransferase family 4 protein [Bryobacteraceae bacterium]